MPISRGGLSPRHIKNNRFIGQVAVHRLLKFCGRPFRIKPMPVTLDLFTSLGFSPRRFAAGAMIIAMEPAEYKKFSEACGLEQAAAIYPLGMSGDFEAVQQGETEYLHQRSRNIVVPADHETVTLAHELLHDIFIGGGIEARDRKEFIKNVLFWYRLAMDPKLPRHHVNRPFFEQVAAICAEKYDIKEIDTRYNFKAHDREANFKVFAGECFAYAGEFLLYPKGSRFDRVPQDIVDFMRQWLRLFDRSVYQRASGQA